MASIPDALTRAASCVYSLPSLPAVASRCFLPPPPTTGQKPAPCTSACKSIPGRSWCWGLPFRCSSCAAGSAGARGVSSRARSRLSSVLPLVQMATAPRGGCLTVLTSSLSLSTASLGLPPTGCWICTCSAAWPGLPCMSPPSSGCGWCPQPAHPLVVASRQQWRLDIGAGSRRQKRSPNKE